MFIGGEPGAGKSRLVSEVCTGLHARGAAVLVGSCIQGYGTPMEPFGEPMRELVRALPESSDLSEDSRRLIELASGSASPGEAPIAAGPQRVHTAVIDLLRSAAQFQPLVLVLEDLHWADVSALHLLRSVVESTVQSRVLVIGTMRSTTPDRSEELSDALAELRRLDGVRRLELLPFTIDDITDFVCRSSGISRAGAIAPATTLLELTGGNPFLLRETWRQVVTASGENDAVVIHIPDSIHDVLRSRLSVLGEDAVATMQDAALLGQEFDADELLAVGEADPMTILDSLDVGVATGLLEAPHMDDGDYRFVHAIARQAFLDQISTSRAAAVHARIAQTLEQQFPGAQRLAQRLAHHYYAARSLGFADQAVHHLARAGSLARRGRPR